MHEIPYILLFVCAWFLIVYGAVKHSVRLQNYAMQGYIFFSLIVAAMYAQTIMQFCIGVLIATCVFRFWIIALNLMDNYMIASRQDSDGESYDHMELDDENHNHFQ